ncbi:hypothetical protein [Chitinilyticum piscinae]|uniref:Uncharacterized protein n=1 Tax=Chitinilyticum piscinae TaxID=2866724 RepID=A0A8J7KBY4_9NEIS|nr:hypothetical protein [Chitinilyticum piscinae]MBE9610714.1 hypothetical protein [Chitinilyticum piscinae]
MSPTTLYQLTAQASTRLPESLRNSDSIRQALSQVNERFPNGMQLDAADLAVLTEASRSLQRRIMPGSTVDVSLQFPALCDISSELFRMVRNIRQDIKDIISDHESELKDDCVGALEYVTEFRTGMAPALARSILLRSFANYVDTVLLAQIRFASENMEIELHVKEL